MSSSFDSLGPSFLSSYESLSLKTQYPDCVEEAVNYIYTKRANDFLHFTGVKVYTAVNPNMLVPLYYLEEEYCIQFW